MLPSNDDWKRASAYYRNHVANHPPSMLPPPLFFDARLGLPQELRPWDPEKGALAGDGPGWGHEEAAVAAAVYQPNCQRCDAWGSGVRLDHGGQVIKREPVCRGCGAFAADGAGPLPKKVRRWGHEQAAVAAAASGSSVAGAAEEPLLSDNVPMLWPPDVEDVRMRTEDSEKTVWEPLD